MNANANAAGGSGAGGAEALRGRTPRAAGMHSVLASISGEMSRLAVGPGAPQTGGRGAFQVIGAGEQNGRLFVLPEVTDLGSLLRVERSDGGRGAASSSTAGGDDGGRRWDPPRVGDARAATWADPSRGSVAPRHVNPCLDAAASDLEAHLAGILRAEPAAQPPPAADQPAAEPEKTTTEGDVEMATEPEPERAPEPSSTPEAEAPAPPVADEAPPVETAADEIREHPITAEPSEEEDDDEDEEEPEPEDQPIDSEFLNALPPDLREELLATNRQIARLNRRNTSADASAAASSQLEPIDPSFISALPPDMQAEVVQQQSREVARVMRERAAEDARRSAQAAAEAAARAAAAAAAAPEGERTEAQRAAAEAAAAAAQAAAQAGGAAQGGMDNASVIASFPEELRQEVLLSADESVLATLPEALQTEARTLRERHAQQMRQFQNAGAARAAAEAAAADGMEDDDEAGGTAAAAFSRQLRTMLGLSGPGPLGGGGGRGVRGERMLAGALTAADRAAKAAKLASPAVDRDALLTLVRLLRLAPPPAKGLLPKVLLNLAAHAPTRDALLRLLFANLRAVMEANEGGGGDCGALYGRDVHVVCSKPDAAARLLAKRALETAVFLARHSAFISRRIPALAVTLSDAADAAAAGRSAQSHPRNLQTRLARTRRS